MSLPNITHLQFLVLGVLLDGPRIGREVREELAELGVKKSGPAFYQMMARLESGGLVKGEYEQQIIEGQRINQRRYEITASGQSAWRDSRDFYVGSIRHFNQELGPAGA